jgi:hypothetical protein
MLPTDTGPVPSVNFPKLPRVVALVLCLVEELGSQAIAPIISMRSLALKYLCRRRLERETNRHLRMIFGTSTPDDAHEELLPLPLRPAIQLQGHCAYRCPRRSNPPKNDIAESS